MGKLEQWDRYLRWNYAIAEVVFPETRAGKPTCLDLEDEVLDEIRDLAEPEADDARAALAEVVWDALIIQQRGGPLGRLIDEVGRWRRGPMTDPPPVLPFLGVLSRAAEEMHGDSEFAANNFYGRLTELLFLEVDAGKRLQVAYTGSVGEGPRSRVLWSALNDWLERLEGNRGVPTAAPDVFKHAHIGWPLSQALVRRVDRERLPGLFAAYGLPPHSVLPNADIAVLLDEWVTMVPCPLSNNLMELWRDGLAAEQICDAVRVVLQDWDGSLPEGKAVLGEHPTAVDTVRVFAALRGFPRRSLELALALPGSPDVEFATADLLGPDDAMIGKLEFSLRSGSWLVPTNPGDLDAASFLLGETRLRRGGAGPLARRRPRKLIPLRRDDLLQGYLEGERLKLGEDSMLLARADIVEPLTAALQVGARPGFTRYDTYDGLPEGWVLFADVQILSSIPQELLKPVDLNVLQPVAVSDIVLQGGMQLPGNIRKWSSLAAPELRVTATTGPLDAVLTCVHAHAEPRPEPRGRSAPSSVLLWDLADEHLPDGDYEIAVQENGQPLGGKRLLRLRSAGWSAELPRLAQERLVQSPGAARFGLSAVQAQAAEGFLLAPVGRALDSLPGGAAFEPAWAKIRREPRGNQSVHHALVVPAPAPDSCMVTGSHHIVLPRQDPNDKRPGVMDGVCKRCGLVKRYPKTAWQAKAKGRKKAQAMAPKVSVRDLEPVRQPPSIDWLLGFDALCHLGEGSIAWLDRVATQMESSGLFGDTFVRRLEALGHIEVELDGRLAPISWRVTPPTLVGLPNGDYVLAGFRSEDLLCALDDALHEHGIEALVNHFDDAPARILIPQPDADVIADVVLAIKEATRREAQVLPDAASTLAAALPLFSGLVSTLPVEPMIDAQSIEAWDPVSVQFRPTETASTVGAYRLTAGARRYIYRRAEDLGALQAVRGDARVVKYLAALEHELPLVGYDEDEQVLYVPLGADLPGLYGRAAVLASGVPPEADRKGRILKYRDVPPSIAAHLQNLLNS